MKTSAILPSIKKKLSAFLAEEDGRISKESLVAGGAAVLALSSLVNAACADHSQNIGHTDSSSLAYASNVVTATHNHYDPAHCNHSNHSSHNSTDGS